MCDLETAIGDLQTIELTEEFEASDFSGNHKRVQEIQAGVKQIIESLNED